RQVRKLSFQNSLKKEGKFLLILSLIHTLFLLQPPFIHRNIPYQDRKTHRHRLQHYDSLRFLSCRKEKQIASTVGVQKGLPVRISREKQIGKLPGHPSDRPSHSPGRECRRRIAEPHELILWKPFRHIHEIQN